MTVTIPRTKGLSESEIEVAERTLGCKLPANLRAFARDHDGATPDGNIFDVPGNQSGVRRFVPLFDALELRALIDGFPKAGLPIAEDDCGNYIWIQLEIGDIRFWDHEVENDNTVVASDFDTFITALRPFNHGSDKRKPPQVTRLWVHPDFKPEFD